MATKKTDPFNPFANFNIGDFDINKMMADIRIPGIDLEAMLVAQRKNIEALTEANRVAVEGMQAVAKRQSEILAQAMAEMSTAAQQLASAEDAKEMTAKQTELTQDAFEKALANMRELAEMINKSNTEAFEVINKRFAESLEELKNLTADK